MLLVGRGMGQGQLAHEALLPSLHSHKPIKLGAATAQEVLFAHLAPQPERPPAPPGPAKYVALLSGLGIGEGGDPARLALAVDYLGGFLGGATEQAMAAQARTILRAVPWGFNPKNYIPDLGWTTWAASWAAPPSRPWPRRHDFARSALGF